RSECGELVTVLDGMPAHKPFQFGLLQLLLCMAAAGPLSLLLGRWIDAITQRAITPAGNELATSLGAHCSGMVCLGASVSTVVVVPVLLAIVHTRSCLRRRRRSAKTCTP